MRESAEEMRGKLGENSRERELRIHSITSSMRIPSIYSSLI